MTSADPVNVALAVTSIVFFGTTMLSSGIAIALWNLREGVKQVPSMIVRLDRVEKDVADYGVAFDSLTGQLARKGIFNRRHEDDGSD